MPRAKKSLAPNPPEKQIVTMPEPISAVPRRKVSAAPIHQNGDLESQIRQRAYELYQERGCTPGRENEDWLEAEREVLARQNQRQSA
jgi:Protein of unknown function (DUF2934)